MSVLEEVAAERRRQDEKWGEQNHPDGTGAGTEVVPLWYAEDFAEWAKLATEASAVTGVVTWREILLEEVAEAFDGSDLDKLRTELSRPLHYTSDPSGVECIEITRHRNFNVGNAIKYLWRAGLKSEADKSARAKQIEDLEKARWYIADEITRLKAQRESA